MKLYFDAESDPTILVIVGYFFSNWSSQGTVPVCVCMCVRERELVSLYEFQRWFSHGKFA